MHLKKSFYLHLKKMDANNSIFKSVSFSFYPFKSLSSMAMPSLPQSAHDATAIPLINSALINNIACLQLGHLYCLVDIFIIIFIPVNGNLLKIY